MAQYPHTPATSVPISSSIDRVETEPRSMNSRRPAPRMAGMAMMKPKRPDSSGESPRMMPVVMTIPDREMPGRRASAWLSPISTASPAVRSSALPEPRFASRARNSTMPVATNAVPTPIVDSWNSSTADANSNPTIPAGTVATTTMAAIRRAAGSLPSLPTIQATSRR